MRTCSVPPVCVLIIEVVQRLIIINIYILIGHLVYKYVRVLNIEVHRLSSFLSSTV